MQVEKLLPWTLLLAALLLLQPEFVFADPGSSAGSSYVDGTAFLQKMLDETSSWADYSCSTEMHNIKPHSETVTHSKFFYKKGPQVRIELEGGFKHGTVLLRAQDGKYYGRAGFWLGGLQMKLDPSSKMLSLPSGRYNALRSDFPETFSDMKEFLSKGYSVKVTAEPIEDPEIKQKVYILKLLDPDKTMTERVYLSAGENHLPVRWDSFTDGEIKSKAWFKNYKIDSGLKDTLFKL
jgi:outer membrane lipoprotein-sorting protein